MKNEFDVNSSEKTNTGINQAMIIQHFYGINVRMFIVKKCYGNNVMMFIVTNVMVTMQWLVVNIQATQIKISLQL